MNLMFYQFRHLRPKIKRVGKRWQVLRGKHGSTRISRGYATLPEAVEAAREIFLQRIIGRAIRYENLRRMGVPQAQ